MVNRVQAAANIPADIFDLHTKNVLEKHDAKTLYTGIEAELAIREYLDKDDGAAVEEKLRDGCSSIGCSPPKRKKVVAADDSGQKRKAQWRIQSGLKDDLKEYANEHDTFYSEVFALAIREYWTNSRIERIEGLADRLLNATEPLEGMVDEFGNDPSAKDKRTVSIAMQLGEQDAYSRDDIETAIADVRGASEYNFDEYTPRVADYKGFEAHPKNEDLFIPHERAAELREDIAIEESGPSVFEQSFDELSSDERVLRIQARLYREAHSRNGKAQLEHVEILDEFSNELGKTTGYNIMGVAAETTGFEIASPHGTKQLRVEIEHVDNNDIVETAEEYSGLSSETETTSAEMDQITSAEPVQ